VKYGTEQKRKKGRAGGGGFLRFACVTNGGGEFFFFVLKIFFVRGKEVFYFFPPHNSALFFSPRPVHRRSTPLRRSAVGVPPGWCPPKPRQTLRRHRSSTSRTSWPKICYKEKGITSRRRCPPTASWGPTPS